MEELKKLLGEFKSEKGPKHKPILCSPGEFENILRYGKPRRSNKRNNYERKN